MIDRRRLLAGLIALPALAGSAAALERAMPAAPADTGWMTLGDLLVQWGRYTAAPRRRRGRGATSSLTANVVFPRAFSRRPNVALLPDIGAEALVGVLAVRELGADLFADERTTGTWMAYAYV